MGTIVSAPNTKPTPEPTDNSAHEPSASLWFTAQDWLFNDAPSWLISTIVHVVLFLVLALALGNSVSEKKPVESATFTADSTEDNVPFSFEPLKIDKSDDQPRELDLNPEPTPPEILMDVGPIESRNPDQPESPGGGLPAPEKMFGDINRIFATGPGPLAQGSGGLVTPNGTSTKPGHGGPDESLRNRGKPGIGITGGPTRITEKSVAAALRWIARHQNADGSWSINHNQKNCRDGVCNGGGSSKADVGATALALLPFLAAGQTHKIPGQYQATIERGLQYLVRIQKQNGALAPASSHEMYEHGLATIALCEAYGMSLDKRLEYPAQAAIEYLQSAQNPQGGWRYKPRSTDTDTSVVGWQVMALKSGQMAGLNVKPQVLELAKADLKRASSGYKGGKFGYMPGRPATPAMTGAGLLCMQYLGTQREDPLLAEGIEYLMQNQPDVKKHNIYYWYYATQVLHNVPGPEWDNWNRKMRRVLSETQETEGCLNGSWSPQGDPWGDNGGRLMVTAMSCLTLEVYYRYLPLYKLDKDAAEKDLK
jgi:hypothetical protein